MSRFATGVARALDRVTSGLAHFSGVLLALVVVLVNVEIVMRYLFNASTLISDEYSGYLFVWMSLLGFGYALTTGQFLRVEAFVERLRGRRRHVLELFGAVAGVVVSIVLTYACARTFLASLSFGTRSIQPSATPLWIPQLAMPLGMAWLVVLYVRIALERLQALRRGLGTPA
jgi:TRAP-type C4-dicarboxylate transport system permease small subunit